MFVFDNYLVFCRGAVVVAPNGETMFVMCHGEEDDVYMQYNIHCDSWKKNGSSKCEEGLVDVEGA